MREPLRIEPLFPDRTAGEPLLAQLVRRLRTAIETGTLPPGTKMMGTRTLAKRLGLGRNTVSQAFEQLTSEGYLEGRVGSGTFVAPPGFERIRHAPPAKIPQPERAANFAALRNHFKIATGEGPLRPGMPDLTMFPSETWQRLARQSLRAYDADLGYGPAAGLHALREAIAMHVRQFRGIGAQPDQIVVVEGAQAALHLASIVLAKPGATVAVEDPAYALARTAFEVHGLRIKPVSVDRDGLAVEGLPRNACFAFVTPTHQYPLGGTLPLARRLELLAWANRNDAYVIEDDYDSEFTSRARPLPALQSLDRDERVIYVGSFSKSLAPGIRVGYLIAPPHLASAFRSARAGTSLGVSLHLQSTLAAFIAGGHFARHIRRMNAVYENRRAILGGALECLNGSRFEVGPMQVGLHATVYAKRRFDDRALAHTPDGQRLLAVSSLCLLRRDCYGFVLGFTNGSDEAIAAAAGRVAKTLLSR